MGSADGTGNDGLIMMINDDRSNVISQHQYPPARPSGQVRHTAVHAVRSGGPRGIATGWTGVDMSTPLLPEVDPEIDAIKSSEFSLGRRGGVGHGLELEE